MAKKAASTSTPPQAEADTTEDAAEATAGASDAASPFGEVSAATRKCMQGNKRRDTTPELKVRRMLRELGFPGYRDKVETVRAASGEREAVVCGTAKIGEQNC